MNRLALVGLLWILLLPVAQVNAELYKWVDEQGNTHYSDKNPATDNLTTITPTTTTPDRSFNKATENNAIILPDGKPSRPLIITDVEYHWRKAPQTNQSTKLGVYYIGTHCSPRGAITSPEVYSYHSRLFPSESSIRLSLLRAIENLGYAADFTTDLFLQQKLAQANGLYLKAVIMDMYLESCAAMRDSQRYLSAKQLRPSFFLKNRVQLSVSWQLFDHPGKAPLFETQTTGYYDNWKSNANAARVIERAFATATINLFSDASFIQQVLKVPEPQLTATPKPAPSSARPPTRQEPGLLSRVFSYFSSDSDSSISETMTDNFAQKAKLSNVLVEITTVKMGATEYYLQHNKWPIKEEIGLQDAMFKNHKLISALVIRYDGTIEVRLKDDEFGPGRKLLLSPNTKAFENNNSLNLDWQCYTNLQPAQNPGSCKTL
ncbi:MAG: DUF4124 domain-containing protein [Gammaproteobacteria bacterium]|nr:DUF4124 domain-containing protein [Gammaproteobacteria bacterium]